MSVQALALASPGIFGSSFCFAPATAAEDSAAEERLHPILDDQEHAEHPVALDRLWEEDECPDEERRREVEALAWRLLGRFVTRLAEFLVEDGRGHVRS